MRVVSSRDACDLDAECCEIILDSADTSALPLKYSGIGSASSGPRTTFVDAQGSPLSVESTRIATVRFGDVSFKEKFIVANITTPLIALGHIIRAGWILTQINGDPFLTKDDKRVAIPCVQGDRFRWCLKLPRTRPFLRFERFSLELR